MKNRQGRTVRSGALGVLLLTLLLLSSCSSGGEKKSIRISVKPNRVAAQEYSNQYVAITPTPALTATPTPTLEPLSVEKPAEEASGPVLPSVGTPEPLLVPLGPPERIVIPSIGIDTGVERVDSTISAAGERWFQEWETAAYAAGFHHGSALLGQPGNTVISGHNNVAGSVFATLYQAQPGEVVHLYSGGFRYDYLIEDQFVVREAGVSVEQRLQNASWIQPTIDERVTLVSCWPPTGNDYRVIVVARPLR